MDQLSNNDFYHIIVRGEQLVVGSFWLTRYDVEGTPYKILAVWRFKYKLCIRCPGTWCNKYHVPCALLANTKILHDVTCV